VSLAAEWAPVINPTWQEANMDLTTVDFGKLLASYPMNSNLPPHLARALADLKKSSPASTSCCMQLCEALNKAGIKVPGKKSFRPGVPQRVAMEIPLHSGAFYLLAVDEMINFLKTFAEPRLIRSVATRTPGNAQAITKSIQGLEGILTFGNDHIEFWNKVHVVQDRGPSAMSPDFLWGSPQIRFWQIGAARPMLAMPPFLAQNLRGWWKVNDGRDYYYFFGKDTVVYTLRAPKTAKEQAPKVPANMADLTLVGWNLELDWDPSGFGATRETFTFEPFSLTTMKGVSNRFDRLTATKMFA
jgi:hypothetical protein